MAELRARVKQVLQDAEARMDAAQAVKDELQAKLTVADAEWRAHSLTFYKLREVLAQPSKPATSAAKKKTTPKSGSKSQRASNMAATLNKNLAQQRQVAKCAGVVKFDGGDTSCDAPENDPIHDQAQGYAGYHEFVAPSAQAASGD